MFKGKENILLDLLDLATREKEGVRLHRIFRVPEFLQEPGLWLSEVSRTGFRNIQTAAVREGSPNSTNPG